MSLHWQAVPAQDFETYLYNFLVPLEAASAQQRLQTSLVNGDITIGVGFDLKAGGKVVQDAVLDELGFDPATVALGANAAPAGGPALIEFTYIQAIRSAIAAGNVAQLNQLMAGRAQTAATDAAYAAFLPEPPRVTFSFQDDDEVRSVFNTLWENYYSGKILNRYPALGLATDAAFQNSRELLAIASIVWNAGPAAFGQGLSGAIASGNRALAWFQIRYGTNPGLAPEVARRRYYESQVFGLFDTPNAPTYSEAVQAYQTLTQYRGRIIYYEDTLGADPDGASPLTPTGQISVANRVYGLTGANAVQTLAQAFAPAETLLVGQLAFSQPMLANLTTDFARSTDIFTASSAIPTVDVRNEDGGSANGIAEASANHILLGSENGDRLIGGFGSDILVAGPGNEVLEAGTGADTLIAGGGNDTLVNGGSNPDKFDFEFRGNTPFRETVIEHGGLGLDSLYVDGTQVGADLIRQPDGTWVDEAGRHYTFFGGGAAGGPQAPAGFSYPTPGPTVGVLQITGGPLGSNEIDLWGFDVSKAEHGGFDGIVLPLTAPSVTGGANAGVDPPAPDFIAGSSQTYTVWVDAPMHAAQTITMTLSGAPAADFDFDTGSGTQALNDDGTFSVTIPAGQTSVSFALTNTVDIGGSASLVLTPSISDPNDPGVGSLSGDPVTQNYVEPSRDPFNQPTSTGFYSNGDATTPGGLAYSAYIYGADMTSVPGNPLVPVGDGNNLIVVSDAPNDSIDGGTGNDTISALFGQGNTDGGVDVINGNGGQDVFNVGYNIDPIGPPDGPFSVRVYANSEESLNQAIVDANSEPATHEQGDAIMVAAPEATLVGGNGNDLIALGGEGVLVAGSGDDTLVSGAHWTEETAGFYSSGPNDPATGVTWSTSFVDDQLEIDGGSFLFYMYNEDGSVFTEDVPPDFEGNTDEVGTPLDHTNSTIFGGGGNDLILLSNGDNEVHLGNGNSTVLGGMGDNTIEGGAGDDSIIAGGGNDYIAAGSGTDFIVGRAGNNTIIGGSGNDTLYAGDGTSNWATLETGDNYVQAGSGNTAIRGSGGNDTLLGGSGTDTIEAGAGNESVVGGTGDDAILGGAGNDTLMAGGDGKDTIVAGSGATTIYGGGGSDLLEGGDRTDIIYAGDGGTADAPTQVVAGSGDTTIYGGDGRDLIAGGGGNDLIYAGDGGSDDAPTQVVAGSGNTTVYGGAGDDQIFGGSGTDVLYGGDGGSDDAPSLVTAGTGLATLYGGAGPSVLRDSLGGSDILVAGTDDTALYGIGSDTLVAGQGNDYMSGSQGVTYVIGADAGNVEIADGGGGGTVQFTSDIDPTTLELTAVLGPDGAPALEVDTGSGSVLLDDALGSAQSGSVVLGSAAPVTLTAWLAQVEAAGNLNGSSGGDGNLLIDATDGGSVVGGAGHDTIDAYGNNETLSAGSGGAQIVAHGANSLVQGGSGGDVLVALNAGTTLVGGTGSELFEVNDPTDVVQAQAGGSDSIESSVSYTLPTGVDFLTLTGTASLTGTGNSDAFNVITGNSGNDLLVAGSGSDSLISGSGADTLMGGSGTDVFYVNNSADVIQGSSAARDSISSSVSYVLTVPVASLTLTGADNLSATNQSGATLITGNAGNDTITAGAGADTLVAGSGVDTLVAGSGNDMFVVDNTADVIVASAAHGSDSVQSSVSYLLPQYVDALTLTGRADLTATGNSDAANLITGNTGNDVLVAGSGDDTLVAGGGIDTLVAGSGSDLLQGADGDTYELSAGFGHIEIDTSSGSATLELGAGLDPSAMSFGMTLGSDGKPALLIQDGAGSVTVDGGLTGTISNVALANGTTISLSQLLAQGTAVSATITEAAGNLVFDGAAADSLAGGYGDDTLIGAMDGDTIVAGTGDQQLYGMGAGDVLVGGSGQDTLYGASSSDTFVGGTGDTLVEAGSGSDNYALTQGGTMIIDASGAAAIATLLLPSGMSTSDFTSYTDSNGDLIVQSLSGDTTAVIKRFAASSAFWLIADSSSGVSLRQWVGASSAGSGEPPPPPSSYRHEIDTLRQQYSVDVTSILNQLGKADESIERPALAGESNVYKFSGVTTQNITGDGSIQIGSSEADTVNVYATPQTITETYRIPIYQSVTRPGFDFTELFNDPSSVVDFTDFNDYSNANVLLPGDNVTVKGVFDGGQQVGWEYSEPTTTDTEQVGFRTVTRTVTVETQQTSEIRGYTDYNVKLGDGDDDLEATAPFVGTVELGNGQDYVDLGEDSSFQRTIDRPGVVSPGAFIEAGDGNDTIYGTGGQDTIAAGLGIDSMVAAEGSTFYVPMEGDSLDIINTESSSYYGLGVYPQNTLVLPTGVTAQNLQVTVLQDPNHVDGSASEILRLRYGNSVVLAYADPSEMYAGLDFGAGVNLVQFADGSSLTRAQLLAMATAGPTDSAPILSASNQTIAGGQPVSATGFFSATDSADTPILWYQVTNTGGANGGYFVLNGQQQPTGKPFYVDADQLSQLTYVGGDVGSYDQVVVQAFDGINLAQPAAFFVNVSTGVVRANGADQTVYGPSAGPDTLIGGFDGDQLVGRSGADTFDFNSGGGAETILEQGAGTANFVQLGAGIAPSAIRLSAGTDGSLTLSLDGGDSINISGFYFSPADPTNPLAATGLQVQGFKLSGGTTLSLAQLLADVGSVTLDNPDGSYQVVSITQDTTISAIKNFDSGGDLVSEQQFGPDGVTEIYYASYLNSDGSSDNTTTTTYPDGSRSYVDVFTPAGGGAQTQYLQNYDTQGRISLQETINPDQSTDSTHYEYNADGTSHSSEVATAPDGTVISQTVIDYDAQGSTTHAHSINADGSTTDTVFTDKPDGSTSYTQVNATPGGIVTSTTESENDSQGRVSFADTTNWDSSTSDISYTYNPDGSFSTTSASTSAAGAVTSTVADYDSDGNLHSTVTTYPDGSTFSESMTTTDVFNDDGSYSTTTAVTAPNGVTTTVDNYDPNGTLISVNTTRPDGSTDDKTYAYNPARIPATTEVETATDGTVTTTVTDEDWDSRPTTVDTTVSDGSTDDTTYTYLANGGSVITEISTAAGGAVTNRTTDYDAAGRETHYQATLPDGSTDTIDQTFNADGSYNSHEVEVAAGGATTDTTTTYDPLGRVTASYQLNPDGSSARLSESYDPHSGAATIVTDEYDSQGRGTLQDSTYADGSSDDLTRTFNPDGSYTSTEVKTTSAGATTTYRLSYDADMQWTLNGVTYPDGSSNTQTRTFYPNGSYTWTGVLVSTDGATTTISNTYDGLGHQLAHTEFDPNGYSDQMDWTYNLDGTSDSTETQTAAGGAVTTIQTNYDTQENPTSVEVTNPDSSTRDTTYTYSPDGSYVESSVLTPIGGAPLSTIVSQYDKYSELLAQNSFTPSADGSYEDDWSRADGSNGQYWWHSAGLEYQQAWANADGTSWTDEYQYAAGGSPGSTGVSFTETYTDSAGDQGSRQYNADTGVTTVSWYSSATSTNVSGAITDGGFVGLQNDGELTNTQADLTFFNPNVSSSFNAFLAGH